MKHKVLSSFYCKFICGDDYYSHVLLNMGTRIPQEKRSKEKEFGGRSVREKERRVKGRDGRAVEVEARGGRREKAKHHN